MLSLFLRQEVMKKKHFCMCIYKNTQHHKRMRRVEKWRKRQLPCKNSSMCTIVQIQAKGSKETFFFCKFGYSDVALLSGVSCLGSFFVSALSEQVTCVLHALYKHVFSISFLDLIVPFRVHISVDFFLLLFYLAASVCFIWKFYFF